MAISFSELLKRPLPSQANAVYEGADDQPEKDEPEDMGASGNCGKATEDALVDDPMDTVAPMDPIAPPVVSSLSDETPAEELTPDESLRVDDTMNAVATPMLLADELDTEESMREFVESVDSDIAAREGFLTERTIVKFDKQAKKAQLYETAVAACAREKKDPLYKKLETVYRMERILKAKLRKKYHSQAIVKVKEYLARAKRSKSGIISKIAKKLTGK